MWHRFFKRFSTYDLLLISLLSSVGLAIKPIATPLVHLVSVPLMIPGGSLAGGFYMMWLALAAALIPKFGSAFLVGLVQAIVVLILGISGSHGIVSLISYTLPGLLVDFVALLLFRRTHLWSQILLVCVANITGTVIVTVIIMRLALLPMLISMSASLISGIIGGVLAYWLIQKLAQYHLLPKEGK
jgi:ABC-type thiamin/hydroxymethylpyrimidine transport system permease subunit